MENPKTEVIKSIKDAQNVLVTVSKNPSVDQLSAAIGMTLVMNKLGKHGTAVFSGEVPSTIEFLKPENTLERNTDSLRDFIISLDKAKADKLRYKVEDQHVKIFITPYKTTLSESDLVFSHGDFNVDVVLALGVHEQTDLDQAITAHGRILHDAKIVSVNVGKPGNLGGINLNENASSLAEVAATLCTELKEDIFDEQISTAFLTGIVAETDRFSNEKTRPETMTVSAKLMAAGANQQLVATKLEVVPEPEPEATAPNDTPKKDPDSVESEDSVKHSDGSLDIKHDPNEEQAKEEPEEAPEDKEPETEEPKHEIHVDEHGNFTSDHESELPEVKDQDQDAPEPKPKTASKSNRKRMILEPPSNSGTLTASDKSSEGGDKTTDPLSLPPVQGPLLSHQADKKSDDKEGGDNQQDAQPDLGQTSEEPKESTDEPSEDTQTLESLEKAVNSPHQATAPAPDVSDLPAVIQDQPQPESLSSPDMNELQSAVDQALAKGGDQEPLEPIAALNANPVDLDLSHDESSQSPTNDEDYLDVTKLDSETGLPATDAAPQQDKPQFPPPPMPGPTTDASGPAAPPPPVPPPMMPPSADDDNGPQLPPVNR